MTKSPLQRQTTKEDREIIALICQSENVIHHLPCTRLCIHVHIHVLRIHVCMYCMFHSVFSALAFCHLVVDPGTLYPGMRQCVCLP